MREGGREREEREERGEDERSERGEGSGREGAESRCSLVVSDTSGMTVQMNGYEGVERGEWRGVGGEGREERTGEVSEGRRRGNLSLSAQSGYSMVVCDTSGVTVKFNGYERVERREGGTEERGERRER